MADDFSRAQLERFEDLGKEPDSKITFIEGSDHRVHIQIEEQPEEAKFVKNVESENINVLSKGVAELKTKLPSSRVEKHQNFVQIQQNASFVSPAKSNVAKETQLKPFENLSREVKNGFFKF